MPESLQLLQFAEEKRFLGSLEENIKYKSILKNISRGEIMLKDSNVCAVLAVKDLDEAKEFYENKLDLGKGKEDPGGVLYKSGDSALYVYVSKDNAGTNQATAAAWNVETIEEVVEDLKSRGVKFEHYDFPGTKREGDIHVMGPVKGAWFKDPSGNILNIVEGM
jgi:catechol 2,3-dioxygenase-like lactoylglutathione lyase family enzyme